MSTSKELMIAELLLLPVVISTGLDWIKFTACKLLTFNVVEALGHYA
ncbi:MAG TPA: hypothetical protein PLD02_03035 [Saprospiraceae bacterium]|nr:hypothetical protein [Saprospiraceae bacterium]